MRNSDKGVQVSGIGASEKPNYPIGNRFFAWQHAAKAQAVMPPQEHIYAPACLGQVYADRPQEKYSETTQVFKKTKQLVHYQQHAPDEFTVRGSAVQLGAPQVEAPASQAAPNVEVDDEQAQTKCSLFSCFRR